MQFTRAVVRPPSRNFADGLSSASDGPPDLDRALAQHAAYVRALRACGLEVVSLEPDDEHPDATFVEDTAIVTARGAVLTRPGARSREGEVRSIAQCLRRFYAHLPSISAPGTVDGGDVCEADGHFLIGVSARTNAAGAGELAEHLGRMGYTSSTIDIRSIATLLHLKSAIAYLGEGLWAVDGALEEGLRSQRAVEVGDLIVVPAGEAYAANCIQVNDAILAAAGYPEITAALEQRGRRLLHLEMSEFKKMDGGLSCLSLRF